MRQGKTRRAALVIACLSLGIGPWIGLPTSASASPWSSFATPGWGRSLLSTPRGPIAPVAAPARGAPTGCTCREISVIAENVVKDAEVETGDATVVNKSITYIAPTYGDDDVEVEQEAIARTGDAVAGQVLAVSGGGEGCSHVTVKATNVVHDAEVRSGDATARNESLILLDPRLQTEELDIDVDQEAEAISGDAIAGQIIGVKGGGGPCGDVILDALNDVRNVEVESGDAVIENISEILACGDAGCLKEIRESLKDVPVVDVCDEQGCHPVKTEKFIAMLKEQSEDNGDAFAEKGADADGDDDDDEPLQEEDDEDGDDSREMPLWFRRQVEPREPKATAAPETEAQAEQDADADAVAAPAASPTPSAPTPSA